jgi:hypothetical protein
MFSSSGPYEQQGSYEYPPDPNGGTDGTYYVVATNGGPYGLSMNFVVHSVSNGSVTGYYTFCGDSTYPNCSDPQIKFDRINGADRWVLTYLEYSGGGSEPSALVVGVSTDSSVLDGFTTYSFAQSYLQDFPHFGLSLDKLVLSYNAFYSSNGLTAGFYVFDTSSLFAGNAAYTLYTYSNAFTLTPQTETGYNAEQLVEAPDGYIGASDDFKVWIVTGTNAGGNLAVSSETFAASELNNYAVPGWDPNASTSGGYQYGIDTNDDRAYTPVTSYNANGPLLWWADNNVCNVGDGGIDGTGVESCTDFIGMTEDPNTGYATAVEAQGYFAGSDASYYFPALTMSGNNGSSYDGGVQGIVDWSTTTTAPSIATFQLTGSGAYSSSSESYATSNGPAVTYGTSESGYPVYRWGDYSGCEYEPRTTPDQSICISMLWGQEGTGAAEDVQAFNVTY